MSKPPSENSGTNQDSQAPAPTDPADRIVALDALRGFALLGILVINISLFGMPVIASVHPPSFGDFTGLDYLAWVVSHVFFEQKFMTLFTFLFGAGMVLFLESKERKGQPGRRLYFRRTIWLLLIGVGHAYLLWYGDILVIYALCGFLVVWVWRWEPTRQLILGIAMYALPAVILLLGGIGYLLMPEGERAAFEEDWLTAFGADVAPQQEIDIYRGGWIDQMAHRVPTAFEFHTLGFVFEGFWAYGGLMVIGMALYKWGVISNERTDRFYHRLLGIGVVGFVLVGTGVMVRESLAWELVPVLTFALQFNYWGAPLVSIGYLAAIMLICRHFPGTIVVEAFAAVGRTAFSNYLLHTVLATTIFYGHGLGMFAQLSRFELLGVVVVIWAIQIPLSVWWLNRYRFGPVEWIWRTLTYGQRQPFRLESES